MVLVDSSVWVRIEHGRAKLPDLLPDDEAATCPIVFMEAVRGTRNAHRYAVVRAMLMSVPMLDAPTPLKRFEEAAHLYLRCRAAGIKPSAADCLVAACAIAFDIPLLHDDRDFEHIARVTELRVFTRS